MAVIERPVMLAFDRHRERRYKLRLAARAERGTDLYFEELRSIEASQPPARAFSALPKRIAQILLFLALGFLLQIIINAFFDFAFSRSQ
jgi:hypothetical protein